MGLSSNFVPQYTAAHRENMFIQHYPKMEARILRQSWIVFLVAPWIGKILELDHPSIDFSIAQHDYT